MTAHRFRWLCLTVVTVLATLLGTAGVAAAGDDDGSSNGCYSSCQGPSNSDLGCDAACIARDNYALACTAHCAEDMPPYAQQPYTHASASCTHDCYHNAGNETCYNCTPDCNDDCRPPPRHHDCDNGCGPGPNPPPPHPSACDNNCHAAPAQNSCSACYSVSREDVTERLMYRTSLLDFEQAHGHQVYPDMVDWNTSGCVGDTEGFNFIVACQRHNFGLRNYRDQDRADGPGLDRINRQFGQDLATTCGWTGPPDSPRACNCRQAAADVGDRYAHSGWRT